MDELTDVEKRMLTFEREWWKYAGAKDQAVRDLFGLGITRYYQLLSQLIERPEALAFEPMVVKRLRKLRETGRQRRRIGTLSLR